MEMSLGLGHQHVNAHDHCMMTIVTYTVPHNGNVHMEMSLGLEHCHVDARDQCIMTIEKCGPGHRHIDARDQPYSAAVPESQSGIAHDIIVTTCDFFCCD